MTNLSTEPTYFTFQMVRLTILPIVEAALFAQAGIVKLIMALINGTVYFETHKQLLEYQNFLNLSNFNRH
jgi:hypothetical protein